ncbi:GNAT family N-acetyltransferase [Nonomuraea sp. NPDC049784]|uniref:GNAT family N-acetyltransferase n=1 Tax=Nonomuraea sp. NPDC049784 TaxID=3154361 RepID=UPI0033F3BACC
MVHIRAARHGDGHAAETLAAIALGDATGAGPAPGPFAVAIDELGGQVPLPHGEGLVFVACPDVDSGQVLGMLYLCPPIRLIDDCADQGKQVQQRLAQAVAEIELLAVTAQARRHGIGSSLLAAAEDLVRDRGGKLVYVKVRHDDAPRLRWYRIRGYHLVASRESVILAVAGTTVAFADGGDGYRVMIKVI